MGERPQALPPVDLHVVSKGTGAAVLLVHGFLGSAFSWRHLMDPLSKAGFAAVAVDLPGFGSTRWPWELDHSHITLADACAPVLRRMAGIPAHVIGHSMGAKVALWLALRHPALVDSLTVVAPAVLTGGVPGGSVPGRSPQSCAGSCAAAGQARSGSPPISIASMADQWTPMSARTTGAATSTPSCRLRLSPICGTHAGRTSDRT